MKEEIWKTIERNPLYMVSNAGRVKRIAYSRMRNNGDGHKPYKEVKNEMILSQYLSSGYPCVNLLGETRVRVHRLVAENFVDGEKLGLHVNHIDGNKNNNSAENLEWVTPRENVIHGYKHKLIKPRWRSVRGVDKDGNGLYMRSLSMAPMFGMNRTGIQTVLYGKRETYKGMIWEYADSKGRRPNSPRRSATP